MKHTQHKPKGPGRPPTYKTESARKNAIKNRMRAYFADPEYKARRQWRYHNDPVYRQQCKDRDRAATEAKRAPLVMAYRERLQDRLARLPQFGCERVCTSVGGRKATRLTFSVSELAAVIDREPYRLYAWIRRGQFPGPAIQTPALRVYSLKQVELLAAAVAAYLPTKVSRLLASNQAATLAFLRAMKA